MTFCWMQFYQLFFQVFLYDSLVEDVKNYKDAYGNSIVKIRIKEGNNTIRKYPFTFRCIIYFSCCPPSLRYVQGPSKHVLPPK